MESLGSAPYSALLCGLYTYGAKTEGDELLKEMKDKKIMLDVHAYNAIIMRTISKYDTADAKRDMVMVSNLVLLENIALLSVILTTELTYSFSFSLLISGYIERDEY